jgi:hypothetical protein
MDQLQPSTNSDKLSESFKRKPASALDDRIRRKDQLLTECFFKAPDETPEEVEHMGYPQLLHLYPPEAILVGPGIAPEEVEEIFVEA